MKKFIVLAFIATILFVGCNKNKNEKDPDPQLSDLVIGKWINTHIDGVPILTDESFVMQLRSDKVQMYADGYIIDDQNKTWTEDENCTYSIQGKTIIINGTNINKYLEFSVTNITQTTMTYKVKKFILNGDEIIDNHSYTLRRITSDFSNQLIGIWKGHETTTGVVPSHDYYWEYFSNGTFNYYYFDEATNMYVKKEDNNGCYYTYGNLLATTFTNYLEIGSEGLYYECWNFSFEGDSMFWTGLREDNVEKSFAMQKVDNPPTINYQQAILGTWVNTKINNSAIFTNNTYVLRFEPSFVEMYAKGYQLDGENKQWKESNNYVYTVDGNIITADGIDALGINTHIEMAIQSISATTMSYSVQKMIIGGEEFTDNNLYFVERATTDYSSAIVGIWKGRETTPGANPIHDVYFKYLENGNMTYYFVNEETGNYEKNESGSYFLYGSFFASNFDINPTSTDGLMFQCRSMSINGNTLESSHLREDGVLQTYMFERTDTPPIQ